MPPILNIRKCNINKSLRKIQSQIPVKETVSGFVYMCMYIFMCFQSHTKRKNDGELKFWTHTHLRQNEFSLLRQMIPRDAFPKLQGFFYFFLVVFFYVLNLHKFGCVQTRDASLAGLNIT